MKAYRILLLLMALASQLSFTSCSEDEDSFAELRDKERKIVNNFIKNGTTLKSAEGGILLQVVPIKVISQEEFEKDTVTDLLQNEYVLFANTGLYMQIIRRGTGKMLKDGETAPILSRYLEYNMAGDSIQTTNRSISSAHLVDQMNITNSYGTLSGTFQSGIMKSSYGNSVPSAWLTPLQYIRLGRQNSQENEIALVRIIAPSGVGTSNQSSLVYPCFFEISYQRGR